MTTVAWDGRTMAADTLATDQWGLKERVEDKILVGQDFLVGCSGESGGILTWWRKAKDLSAEELLAYGYPGWGEGNNPGLLLVCCNGAMYRHGSGVWLKAIGRRFHAVGSGRDYALMAMHLGKTAAEAVRLTMEFDNGTGGDVVEMTLPHNLRAKD